MNPEMVLGTAPVPSRARIAWAWAALAWLLLAWQGGLHPWQVCAASLALGALLATVRGVGVDLGWGPVRILAKALPVWAVLCAFAALRPQADVDAALGLGLAAAAVGSLKVSGGAREDWTADAWTWLGGLASAAFLIRRALGFSALEAARAFFPNQNLLAGGLAVPALLLGLRHSGAGARQRLERACALAAALAIVSAGSRGALLALAAGAGWMALRRAGQARAERAALLRRLALWLGLLALAVAFAPFSRLATRVRDQRSAALEDDNYYRRADFWAGAVELSLERPVWGFGLGGFAQAARALDLPTPLTPRLPVARYHLNLEHAHDEWLEFACELGWPACLALLAVALAWFLRRRGQEAGPDAVGLEAVLLAAAALSLVDMDLRTPALLWGLLLAWAALEPAGDSRTEGASPGRAPGRFAGAALGTLALLTVAAWGGAALARTYLRPGPKPPWLGRVALWSQPLDGAVAARAQDQGLGTWPWSAWSGRMDPGVWWRAALRARARGETPEAEDDAKRAVELSPYSAPGWFWLGQLLALDGKGAAATACMRHAVGLEPHFCRALAWLADQARAQGRPAQAARLYAAIRQSRSLTQDTAAWDPYSRYLVSLDPAWIRAHPQVGGGAFTVPNSSGSGPRVPEKRLP